MGDDPYNFEIALPATPSHANRSTRKIRASDSDEDVSDVSGSLSSMSGISSDNGSDRESDHELQERTESSFKRPTKRTNESKIAAPSSGNALDRAKNFLSKYSNVGMGDRNETNAPTSSRSRRVSLDLDDDDDFSVEFSGYDEEDTTNKKASATSFSSGVTINKKDNRRSKDYGFVPKPDEMNDEDESEQSSDHPPAYSETRRAPTPLSAMPTRRESNSDESEVGDSIESFHSAASEGQLESIPVVTIPQKTQPKPAYQEDSADDYNESFQEESLSQSNIVDNQYRDIQPSRATPAFTPEKPQQLIASDSGVYEEEVFEQEGSVVAAPAPTTSIVPLVAPQTIMTTDKSFDYSMDFSDNEVEAAVQPQFQIPQSITNDPVRRDSESLQSSVISGQSDHDRDNEEQSELLASGSVEDERSERTNGVTDHTTVAPETVKERMGACNEVPVDRSSPIPGNSGSHEQIFSAHDRSSDSFDMENEIQAPNHKIIDTPSITTGPTQKVLSFKDRSTDEAMSAAKQRVTIVRAFQRNEEEHVETKDASTQFTGNHAAIQADLIPDGMHNAFVSASSQPTKTTSPSFGGENDVRPCDVNPNPCQSEQQPPPAPPISTLFGSSLNNLDALKLPMTTSTSIYKQQLLKLQEQILQKKRETERIVHDRMTFQYSSLRGAERFIAARRAQKLELWEALMRVDPALDEQKAREVARLAQAASM